MKNLAAALALLSVCQLNACTRRPAPVTWGDGVSPVLDRRVLSWSDIGREAAVPDARRDGPKKVICTPGARLTYVVDDAARVRTFDPTSGTPLVQVGTLKCPLGGHPHSMAVRHDGIAFVLYATDLQKCSGLARVDLNTMSCKAATAYSCQLGDFALYGMGYALAGPTGEETLFIAAMGSPLLSTLDPDTGKISGVGGAPAPMLELTGNSKGELWGFTPEGQAAVYRLDAGTGIAVQSFYPPIPPAGGARSWAFAAWGGVFYIFFGDKNAGGTSVYRFTSDGKLTTYLTKTGINIVGAGSAVCAGS